MDNHEKEPMFSAKNLKLLTEPLGKNNPITVQVLGICSALAVTVKLKPAIVMALSVIIVTAVSNFVIAAIRKFIPDRIRIIVQLVVVGLVLDGEVHVLLGDVRPLLGGGEDLPEGGEGLHDRVELLRGDPDHGIAGLPVILRGIDIRGGEVAPVRGGDIPDLVEGSGHLGDLETHLAGLDDLRLHRLAGVPPGHGLVGGDLRCRGIGRHGRRHAVAEAPGAPRHGLHGALGGLHEAAAAGDEDGSGEDEGRCDRLPSGHGGTWALGK